MIKGKNVRVEGATSTIHESASALGIRSSEVDTHIIHAQYIKMLLFYKIGLCEFSALEIKNVTDSFKQLSAKGGLGLFIKPGPKAIYPLQLKVLKAVCSKTICSTQLVVHAFL